MPSASEIWLGLAALLKHGGRKYTSKRQTHLKAVSWRLIRETAWIETSHLFILPQLGL